VHVCALSDFAVVSVLAHLNFICDAVGERGVVDGRYGGAAGGPGAVVGGHRKHTRVCRVCKSVCFCQMTGLSQNGYGIINKKSIFL